MPAISAHQSDDAQSVLDTIGRQLTITDEQLVEITKAFVDEFQLGLNNYGKDMAMIPTFVPGVPDGSEKGTFLALDLGGTNLRVCEVVLNGDKTFSLTQKKYKVSETLKQGEASALFDYIADSVDAFLTSHAKTDYNNGRGTGDAVYLGFTFSFPVEQTALAKGKILTWTKGYAAKNAVGNDVVQLLQDAFDRKHMHVKCIALVNDTVGTLLTRSYIAGGALIGAIFGTGTNGAYVEEISNLKKLAGTSAAKGEHMIINCEWGAFNNSRTHLPITPYDNTVDRLSINPKYQTFEKFISGMYLGEIVRLIAVSLVDAVPQPLLFKGKSTAALNKHYGLDTSFMSQVEEAWIGEDRSEDAFELPPLGSVWDESKLNAKVLPKLQRLREIVATTLEYKLEDVSYRDAAILRWLSELVANRSAVLSGVAVAAVLVQTGRGRFPGDTTTPLKGQNDTLGVGVDGSLVEHYPNYEKKIRHSVRVVVGEDVEKRVDIGLAKDGSGVGAALCALQALKQL
ncbi:hypothetical protein MD484_g3907, partial [Candolleomyces efflorescens]